MIEIGSPIVQGAKVEANLIKNSKRTVLIFKRGEDKILEERMDIDKSIQ